MCMVYMKWRFLEMVIVRYKWFGKEHQIGCSFYLMVFSYIILQFRALSDQMYRSPEYHKHVRKDIVKQVKDWCISIYCYHSFPFPFYSANYLFLIWPNYIVWQFCPSSYHVQYIALLECGAPVCIKWMKCTNTDMWLVDSELLAQRPDWSVLKLYVNFVFPAQRSPFFIWRLCSDEVQALLQEDG